MHLKDVHIPGFLGYACQHCGKQPKGAKPVVDALFNKLTRNRATIARSVAEILRKTTSYSSILKIESFIVKNSARILLK